MSDDEAPNSDRSEEPSSSRGDASEDSLAASADPKSTPVPIKAERTREAPDPVVGIGLVILGVLVMGIAGAATLHYVFNIGTAIAIIGAVVFLVSVVLSSLKERPRNPSRVSEPRMQ